MVGQFLALYTDVPEGGSLIVNCDGNEIALFKTKGNIYALENACPHKKAPLGEGEVLEDRVICPRHYWEFDLKTGKSLDHEEYCAKKYELLILDNKIFLK